MDTLSCTSTLFDIGVSTEYSHMAVVASIDRHGKSIYIRISAFGTRSAFSGGEAAVAGSLCEVGGFALSRTQSRTE